MKDLIPAKNLWIISGPIGTDYSMVKPVQRKQIDVFITIYDFLKERDQEIDLKNLRQERQNIWTQFYQSIRNGSSIAVADSFTLEMIAKMKNVAQKKGYNVHILTPPSPGPNIGFWNTKRLGLYTTGENIFDYYGDVPKSKK